MKRGLIFGVIIILMLMVFISAQAIQQPTAQDAQHETQEKTPEEIAQELKAESKGLPKKIGDKTNEVLSKELILPTSLKTAARIIFGITSDKEISIAMFIVLVAVWFMLFLIISSTLNLVPFFESWKAWAGGFIVTTIVAITGAVRSVAYFFFGIGDIFSIFEKWSALKILFLLIILLVFGYGASIILKMLKKRQVLESAEMKGIEAGAGVAMARQMYKQTDKLE